MLEALKQHVLEAHRQLAAHGLVVLTWGNVSGIDRDAGLVVIKPSGVPYEHMEAAQMVVVSLETAQGVEGALRPSSDLPTHLALYRAFPGIGAVVHTHSPFATAWAQARCDLPAVGTTHADYFHGPVPCTRALRDEEIAGDYEAQTGQVIVERFAALDPRAVPAVLVAHHGPFAWGPTPAQAVENAFVLEYVAHVASLQLGLGPSLRPMPAPLLDKHFLRKHGPGRYYGQP